jgi:hypothetical protein
VFFKYNKGVVVLFHATLRTLDGRLEPGHDTPGVEHVATPKFLVGSLDLLKTHSTCFGKVCTTPPVFDRL